MKILQNWRDRGRRARAIALADRLTEDGQFAPALEHLEPLLAADPADTVVGRKVVEAYAELGRADELAAALAALVGVDPQQVTLINNASFDDFRAGDAFRQVYETAIQVIAVELDDAPDDAAARFLLAEYHEALGHTTAARGEYALLRRDDDPRTVGRAAYMDARLHALDGATDRATELLRDAVAAAPDMLVAAQADTALVPLLAGSVLAELQEGAAAAEENALRELVAASGENPVPRRQLVELLRAGERYDEALEVTNAALEDFPTDAGLLEAQADCLFDLGQHDEALTSYQEALRLHQGRPWPVYRAGVLYERKERKDAARSAYWDALDSIHDDAGLALMVARGMARVEDEAGMYAALRRTAQISLTLREPSPEDVLKAISAADEFGAWLEEADFVAVLDELAAENEFEDG
jgi:tetratricopeptide (TPR) repeat protein